MLDVVPLSALSLFLLFVSEFSLSSFGLSAQNLLDRIWDRSNQQIIEIVGHQHRFLLGFVANLRFVTSIVFVLSSLLAVVAASTPGISASILLTLNSATSFLVDFKDGSSDDTEKQAKYRQLFDLSCKKTHKQKYSHNFYQMSIRRHEKCSIIDT